MKLTPSFCPWGEKAKQVKRDPSPQGGPKTVPSPAFRLSPAPRLPQPLGPQGLSYLSPSWNHQRSLSKRDLIRSGFPVFRRRREGSRSPTTKTPPVPLPPPGPGSSLPRCGSGPSAPSPSPARRGSTHLHLRGRGQGVGKKGPGESLCQRAVLHKVRPTLLPPPPPDSPGLRAGAAEEGGRGLQPPAPGRGRTAAPEGAGSRSRASPRACPASPHGLAFC